MANPDRPNGANPKDRVRRLSSYTAGGTIYKGDFVHMEDDGLVDAAVASEALIGVAANSATSGNEVLVYDDPDQRFTVQADEADVDAQTDIGLNYNIVATAGSSTYSQSRQELDSSSGATTATLPLRLLAVEPRADNALGAQAECIVLINNHQLAKASVGL